jgi:hypothetical protein
LLLPTDDDALAAPFGDRGTVFITPYMPPHESAGGDRELTSEVPDPARGAVDQHLAAEQQPALPQCVQRGQPGSWTWSLTPLNIVVKAFGSKPFVSSR